MKPATIFWSFVFCVAACTPLMPPSAPTSHINAITVTKTLTTQAVTIALSPTSTLMPMHTLTPLPTATATATASDTPNPSETILLSYFSEGTDGWPEWPDACLMWIWRYRIVLYADGRLIFHTEQGLFEKALSAQEINDWLTQGTNTPKPIAEAERILASYQSSELKRYIPSELWLEGFDITDAEVLNYPEVVKPDPTITSWSSKAIKLIDLANKRNIAEFKGNEILSLLPMFPRFPMVGFFSENDRKYIVVACPVLPE